MPTKLNGPIRLQKVVTGYKGNRTIKGTNDTYRITADTDKKSAVLYDSSNNVVANITANNERDLLKKIREGLVELGVVFPNHQKIDVPFLAFEIQNLAFNNVPNFGVFKINYGAQATANISYTATASQVQAALRLLTGLENVLVTGSIAASLNVDFRGVSGNLSNVTISDKTLELRTDTIQTVTFSGVRASGEYVLNYDGNASAAIAWNDAAAAIQTKLRAVAGLSAVTVADTSGTVITVTFVGNIAATALTVSGNTLQTVAPAAITTVVADATAAATVTTITVSETSAGE